MKISLMTFMVVIRKLIAGSISAQDKKDYSEFLKNVKTAGIDHVDLTIMEFASFGESYVKEVLREYDLKMSCLISGRQYANPGTSVLEDFKWDAELAQSLDCKIVMAVPFGYETQNASRAEFGLQLKRSFSEVADYADRQGLIIVIEDDPHLDLPMCSAAELTDLLAAAPNLRMVFDTANMVLAGENPLEYYQQFKSKIKHMHIKDIMTITDPDSYGDLGVDGLKYTAVKFGEGVIDLKGLLPVIEKDGFDGFGALEFVPKDGVPSVGEIKRELEFVLDLRLTAE